MENDGLQCSSNSSRDNDGHNDLMVLVTPSQCGGHVIGTPYRLLKLLMEGER